jgi:hypothetical protein
MLYGKYRMSKVLGIFEKDMCVMIIANKTGRAKMAELAGLYQASCWDLLGSQ